MSFYLGVEAKLVILALNYFMGNFLSLLTYIYLGSLESVFSYIKSIPSDPPTKNALFELGKYSNDSIA